MINPLEFSLDNILFNQLLQRKYWKYHDTIYSKIVSTDYHPIHKFASILELQIRNLLCVVNQSVDNLYEKNDIPPQKILYLNGREFYSYCVQCNTQYDRNKIFSNNQENPNVYINEEEQFPTPLCEKCNIPLIIENAETNEQNNVNILGEMIERCDLFILLGESLLTSPPITDAIPIALSMGTKIVMISENMDMEETAFDLVIQGSYNIIFSIINEQVQRKRSFKRASISVSNERFGSGLILGGSRV